MRIIRVLLIGLLMATTAIAQMGHQHMMGEQAGNMMKQMSSIQSLSSSVTLEAQAYALTDWHMFSLAKEFVLNTYQYDFFPKEIKVKKGDRVRLFVTSDDVKHGVYIKEYGINVSVERGAVKVIEFIADQAGEFEILCSVYCGRDHHKMKGKLIVGR